MCQQHYIHNINLLILLNQYTDAHGEVCPSGWKPGKATMKPNPTQSKVNIIAEIKSPTSCVLILLPFSRFKCTGVLFQAQVKAQLYLTC